MCRPAHVLLIVCFPGLVAAAAALQHRAQPPVLNLRDLNPYVASAVGDYAKPAVNLSAAIPRGMCMSICNHVLNQRTASTSRFYLPNSVLGTYNAHPLLAFVLYGHTA
jgi:hypothetical protein